MSPRLAVVSVGVSHVSVIPTISSDLVCTRSEIAGAFSRMERAFIVAILKLRCFETGPGLTATSPERSSKHAVEKLSCVRGMGNIFLLQQMWRAGS